MRMHFNFQFSRENILFHPDLLCLKNNGFGNLGTLIKWLEFFTCIEILYETRISLFIEIFMNFLHWSQENLTKVTTILPCPKRQRTVPLQCSPDLGDTREVPFVWAEGTSDARTNTPAAMNHLSLARSACKLKFMASPHVSRAKFAALSILLLCRISLKAAAAHCKQEELTTGGGGLFSGKTQTVLEALSWHPLTRLGWVVGFETSVLKELLCSGSRQWSQLLWNQKWRFLIHELSDVFSRIIRTLSLSFRKCINICICQTGQIRYPALQKEEGRSCVTKYRKSGPGCFLQRFIKLLQFCHRLEEQQRELEFRQELFYRPASAASPLKQRWQHTAASPAGNVASLNFKIFHRKTVENVTPLPLQRHLQETRPF